MATRRGNELEKASRRIRGEDRRTWVALRRSYSVAEELALRQFESTAIFEPFGGTFGVTRMAAEKFGWTNSQPLDLVDGYDLLKKAGRELVARTLEEHDPFLTVIAFDCRIWSLMCNMNHTIDWEALRSSIGRETIRLVRWICWHRHQRGRYYLVENPAGSAAWEFDRLREELREKAGGKFIISDQCRYGLKDSQSGRPIKKPTGWASNAEVLLNHLGKKCRCRWGEHEHLLGSNRDGPRAKRAASYPTGLCTAICQGALETMRLDYAIYMSGVNAAFPVEDEDEEMPLFDDREEGQPEQSSAEEDMARDAWRLNGNTLRRIHVVPRCRLFTPLRATDPPVEVEKIGPTRKTQMKKADGSVQIHEDLWAEPHPDFTETDYLWTGYTEFQLVEVEERRPDEEAEPVEETAEKDEEVKRDRGLLKRRRARTRQLQRGLWVVEEDEAVKERLQATLELMNEQDVHNWMSLEKGSELFEAWASAESAQAEVQLILCSRKARRMRKPQPFAEPAEVPLRKGFLLLENSVLCTYWETWTQLAPQAQIRPLVAEGRQLYVVMFGKELGDHLEVEKDDRYMAKEQERMRRWNALPRELKLAVKRIHVNLGHANIPSMLRALRVSRASEVALRAVRLFRCEDCPRIQDPKQPRPSKLPLAEEFNVQIGMDVLQEKDSAGHTWSWLNILCQGATFQVCVLLGDVHHNPSGKDILEAFLTGWTTWAGYPERGLVTDRAKPFLSEVAEDLAEHGCTFDSAAKAAPWQIGQIERHGGLWKGTFRRAAWSQQASGLDGKHGFSPSQWVLGKDLRLPADLADDSEVSRIGAQALADTPGTKFFRKTQLRMAAREAFARTANSEALRRAELRKVRPTRGPFLPGMYVWYYDQADRAPGPNNWRGVARVIGKEGRSTVWISHRGILLAVAPEHLSRAFDEEVRNWTVVAREHELIDATPAAGGTSFIDLRKAPAPGPAALPIQEAEDETREEVPEGDNGGDIFLEEAQEDLSASSTSMARMHLESERERKRELRSGEFFQRREEERRQQREEKRRKTDEGVPVTPAQAEETLPSAGSRVDEDPDLLFDPEVHDYHQSRPTRQLSPLVEDAEAEANEREAKRLRTSSHDGALWSSEGPFAHMVFEVPNFLRERARVYYSQHVDFYQSRGIDEDVFLFGVRRNVFDDRYEALAAQEEKSSASGGAPMKKKGRKELRLQELREEQQQLFTGRDGSDAKEWEAWLSKEACTVLDYQTSKRIRREKPDLIIPTRWVRTNKTEGILGQAFKAKSRLVVQGFKDKSLGHFRRDAPTASAVAESIVLAVSAFHRFVLVAKDIKNAYFSGKSVGREIYLDPPKGGLPGVQAGQLLKANKAIYGFAEAARLFWLALREHLLSDGWCESRLEPALFYLRKGGALRGILVTHVDDIEGGIHPGEMETAFQKSSLALEFATNQEAERSSSMTMGT